MGLPTSCRTCRGWRTRGWRWEPRARATALVVVLVDRAGRNKAVDIAGVLAEEEGRDTAQEDGVKRLHHLCVRDGDAFVAVFGAHAAEVLVLVVQQLDGLDDGRIGEKLATKYGLLQDGIELRVAFLQGAGQTVARRVQKLGSGVSGHDGGGGSGERPGKELAAINRHRRGSLRRGDDTARPCIALPEPKVLKRNAREEPRFSLSRMTARQVQRLQVRVTVRRCRSRS